MIEELHENSDKVPEVRSLPRETPPSPALEDRVVTALRRVGLLRAPVMSRRAQFVRVALAVAAAIAFFAAGWFAGAPRPATPAPDGHANYVLFLRAGPGYKPAQGTDEERIVEEYRNWARGLREAGVAIRGEKLKDDTRSLAGRGGQVVFLEGTAADTSPVLGFFLVEARDLGHALAIAQGCPHLRYGGIIEVRPIAPT